MKLSNLRFALCASVLLAFTSPMAYAFAPLPAATAEPVDPVAKKISGSKDYVSFFGIRASVTSGFSVAGYMAVDAGLHIEKDKIRKHVASIRPRLSDTMRMAVTSYANGPYKDGSVPDLDILRARMQKAVDKQLGVGAAQVVLASVIVFNAD